MTGIACNESCFPDFFLQKLECTGSCSSVFLIFLPPNYNTSANWLTFLSVLFDSFKPENATSVLFKPVLLPLCRCAEPGQDVLLQPLAAASQKGLVRSPGLLRPTVGCVWRGAQELLGALGFFSISPPLRHLGPQFSIWL